MSMLAIPRHGFHVDELHIRPPEPVTAAVALTNRMAPVQVLTDYGPDSSPVAAEDSGNWVLRWLKSLVRYSIILVPLMLALVVLLFRRRETLDALSWAELKG